MANPIIDSITHAPDPVVAGTATVTVAAHHPDDKSVTVDVVVRDGSGGEVTGQLVFPSTHPLTYEVTADVGAIAATAEPNVFTWSE